MKRLRAEVGQTRALVQRLAGDRANLDVSTSSVALQATGPGRRRQRPDTQPDRGGAAYNERVSRATNWERSGTGGAFPEEAGVIPAPAWSCAGGEGLHQWRRTFGIDERSDGPAWTMPRRMRRTSQEAYRHWTAGSSSPVLRSPACGGSNASSTASAASWRGAGHPETAAARGRCSRRSGAGTTPARPHRTADKIIPAPPSRSLPSPGRAARHGPRRPDRRPELRQRRPALAHVVDPNMPRPCGRHLSRSGAAAVPGRFICVRRAQGSRACSRPAAPTRMGTPTAPRNSTAGSASRSSVDKETSGADRRAMHSAGLTLDEVDD